MLLLMMILDANLCKFMLFVFETMRRTEFFFVHSLVTVLGRFLVRNEISRMFLCSARGIDAADTSY